VKPKTVLLVLFFILLVGYISAVPNVTVVYPNGGEVLFGTRDIKFKVSEPQNKPVLNASLFYSILPGNKTNLIDTIDLLHGNYCTPPYSQGEFWRYVGGDLTYSRIIPSRSYFFTTDWKDGSFDGNLMYFGRGQTGSWGSDCYWANTAGYIDVNTGKMVETDVLSNAYNNVPPTGTSCYDNFILEGGNPQSSTSWSWLYHQLFFKPDEETPSIGLTYYYAPHNTWLGGHRYYNIQTYDWSGNTFERDYSGTFNWFDWHEYLGVWCCYCFSDRFNGNICQDGNCVRVTFREPFSYGDNFWLVGRWTHSPQEFTVCNSDPSPAIQNWYGFRYLGDNNWMRDDSLVANTDINALTFFWQGDQKCKMTVSKGNIYCIGFDEFENPAAIIYKNNNWQRVQDFNKGIAEETWKELNDYYAENKLPFVYRDNLYLLQTEGSSGSGCGSDNCQSYQTWAFDQNIWNTADERTCSYKWNTATAQQGNWYLDVNISDGSETGQDSSDGNFLIGNSCGNGIKDADETDVDCGGSCLACEEGRRCLQNSDCISTNCNTLYNICDVPGDLYIEWIKPIQVIEDVPLVAGKATVVRVKVVNNGPEVETDVALNYGNGCFTETKPVLMRAFSFQIVDFYPPNNCTQ
jgi:hypothetical protein